MSGYHLETASGLEMGPYVYFLSCAGLVYGATVSVNSCVEAVVCLEGILHLFCLLQLLNLHFGLLAINGGMLWRRSLRIECSKISRSRHMLLSTYGLLHLLPSAAEGRFSF